MIMKGYSGKPMFRLDHKIILITGAATGIGAGIAIMMARRGGDIIISDRPGVNLDTTVEKVREEGGRAYQLEMDVTDLRQIDSGIARVKSEIGKVDVLVNNAGINRPAKGMDVTEELFDQQFDTNIKGGFFLAQKMAPDMIANQWGRIIWISSQSGLVAIPGQPVYCASKGAVIQMVRTLAIEWAQYGITVNSIAPTYVETNLTRNRLKDPEFLSYVLAKIPSHHLAKVEDVAAAAIYLASEEASMVNGHTLSVDGGWTVW
jgi:NAD(P)-dependent dehydrogenase (short-subunit alcohol dehydrogenase family)